MALCQPGFANMCNRSNDGGLSIEPVCCPSGQGLECCSTNGYCCDGSFASLHWAFAIPLLILAVGILTLNCLHRKGAPRGSICLFSILNFVFFLLVGLGTAPLCGEDAVQQAQTSAGGPWHRFNDPFSPVGDCTTAMLICWGIAAGFWLITGCFAACRTRLNEDKTVVNTPADIIARTKRAVPRLGYHFVCSHTITTHSTDAQGKPTTQTSTVTTKSGTVPIDLDVYFEDISAPVPPEFATKDHATELDLNETYQCSPALELITQAVKSSVDTQWRNFDSSYSGHFMYNPVHEEESNKCGRGTYLCYPNKTQEQLEAKASRNYYLAACNCFLALQLALVKRDYVQKSYDVCFRVYARGERSGQAAAPTAVAMAALAASQRGSADTASARGPPGGGGGGGMAMGQLQMGGMAGGGQAINPLYGLNLQGQASPQQQAMMFQQQNAMQQQMMQQQHMLMMQQQMAAQQAARGRGSGGGGNPGIMMSNVGNGAGTRHAPPAPPPSRRPAPAAPPSRRAAPTPPPSRR